MVCVEDQDFNYFIFNFDTDVDEYGPITKITSEALNQEIIVDFTIMNDILYIVLNSIPAARILKVIDHQPLTIWTTEKVTSSAKIYSLPSLNSIIFAN